MISHDAPAHGAALQCARHPRPSCCRALFLQRHHALRVYHWLYPTCAPASPRRERLTLALTGPPPFPRRSSAARLTLSSIAYNSTTTRQTPGPVNAPPILTAPASCHRDRLCESNWIWPAAASTDSPLNSYRSRERYGVPKTPPPWLPPTSIVSLLTVSTAVLIITTASLGIRFSAPHHPARPSQPAKDRHYHVHGPLRRPGTGFAGRI